MGFAIAFIVCLNEAVININAGNLLCVWIKVLPATYFKGTFHALSHRRPCLFRIYHRVDVNLKLSTVAMYTVTKEHLDQCKTVADSCVFLP